MGSRCGIGHGKTALSFCIVSVRTERTTAAILRRFLCQPRRLRRTTTSETGATSSGRCPRRLRRSWKYKKKRRTKPPHRCRIGKCWNATVSCLPTRTPDHEPTTAPPAPSRQSHHALVGLRFQRGGEQFVTEHRFVRGDTAETIPQLASALGRVSRPHLQEAIGKTRFENPAGDRRKNHLMPEIEALPDLFLSTLEQPERFRL